MRAFATIFGLIGVVLGTGFRISVATTHSIYAHPGPGTLPIVMFTLLLIGAVGSVLAGIGVRWAPVMIAVAVIPAAAGYLIPGLIVVAAAMAANNANQQRASGL